MNPWSKRPGNKVSVPHAFCMSYCRNEGQGMLKKIVTVFALLLLTVIAVTQSIDVYNTHFSSNTEEFVVTSLGLLRDPPFPIEAAVSKHGNTSGYSCASHGFDSSCGYVTYLDPVGQEATIYVDKSGSCFKESVITELLPVSCRS